MFLKFQSLSIYTKDCATEDQVLTPWTASVASGHNLLREPRYNKGLAFTEKERDAHYLRGLLPPAVLTQELQEKKMMHNLRKYEVPLKRFAGLKDTHFFTISRIARFPDESFESHVIFGRRPSSRLW